MRWPDKVSRAGRSQRHGGTGSSTQLVLGAALQRAELYAANESFRALARLGPNETGKAKRQNIAESDAISVRTMLLKPVGDRCNLGCPYCYEEDRRSTFESGRLTLAQMAQVLDSVLPFVEKPFDIFVHGGEPLLAGKAFFEGLVAMVKDHPFGNDVSFGVQTNGVLIDRDWAEFFAEHDFSVGVSLDGPPEIHDTQRPTKQGQGTHDAVLAGLQILNEAKVPVGVTSVISAPHARIPDAAAKLFEHFIALGITRFDTHPAFAPIGPSQLWNLSPTGYSNFMCDLFDDWVAYGDPSVIIRSFEEFFRSMTGFSAQTCFRSQGCQSIIGVDPDGKTTACTRPFASKYDFGNLINTDLPTVQSSEGYQRFARDEAAGRAQVNACVWAHHCGHGGCPHERLKGDSQAVAGRHVYCTCHDETGGGYPAIYKHIYKRVEATFD